MSDFAVKASAAITAPAEKVWDALTKPEEIKKYMFGTEAVSDWRVGSPIVFKGEWEGKPYEDKGEILEIEPYKRFRYTHSNQPSALHTITYELEADGDGTRLTITQDGSATQEEADSSTENWQYMLNAMKELLESKS